MVEKTKPKWIQATLEMRTVKRPEWFNEIEHRRLYCTKASVEQPLQWLAEKDYYYICNFYLPTYLLGQAEKMFPFYWDEYSCFYKYSFISVMNVLIFSFRQQLWWKWTTKWIWIHINGRYVLNLTILNQFWNTVEDGVQWLRVKI